MEHAWDGMNWKMGELNSWQFFTRAAWEQVQWKVSCAEWLDSEQKVLSNLFRFIVSYRENIYVIRNLFLEKRRNRTLWTFLICFSLEAPGISLKCKTQNHPHLAGSDKYIRSYSAFELVILTRRFCVLINSSINPISSEDCKGTHTQYSVHLLRLFNYRVWYGVFVKSESMEETYVLKLSIYILHNVQYVFVFNYISDEESSSFKIVYLIVNRKHKILIRISRFWICL